MSNEFVARKGLISLQTSSFKEDVYISGSLQVGTFPTSSHLTVSGSGYVSKGLVVDGGITGSLYGTSSWAVSASWAPNAGTASYVLGNVSASYIDFSQTADLPNVVGRLQWDSDLGTLKYGLPGGNVTAELGMDVLAYVYNAEATTLNKGEAVYISGSITDRVAVKRASALSDDTSAKTLGLVAESIPAGGTGYVVNRGYLLDVDTSAYTAGTTLYLSGSAGQLTSVKPKAPIHLVYVGVVVKVGGGSSGRIYVFTQNGYELDEIHDVRINGKTSGDLLVYSSSGLWENTKTLPGQYYISGGLELTGSLNVYGPLYVSGSAISASIVANPYGNLILASSGSGIASGSVEIHGGLKWKRTPTAVATEIGDLITFGATLGAIEGGELTTASIGGFVVQAAEMVAYTMTTFPYSTHNVTKFDTFGTSAASRQLTLPQTSSNYVYYNNSGVLTYAATAPSSRSNILLGKVITDATKVIYIDATQINAHHYSNYLDRMFREALGPIFYTGGIVTQGTTSGSLNVTAATYFFSQNRITTNGSSPATMHTFYRGATSGQFVRTTGVTVVNTASYDNNTNSLTSIPSGKYAKHSLYLLGDNSLQATANEEYLMVYGQTLYDSVGDAVAGALPTPPSYFTDQIVIIASIVVTPDSGSIQQLIDERPRLGFVSPSKTGVITAHGDLTGLSNDDHPQYLLTDGTRTLTGNLNLGNYNISNVNSIVANSITGSLLGTSSYALTASYIDGGFY